MQVRQLGFRVGSLQPARVLLERIHAQRPLPLGEIREAQRVMPGARRQRPPKHTGVQFHQRFERTAFLYRRTQRQRIHPEDAHFDGECTAFGGIFSVDDVIRVQIFGNAQHRCAAERGAARQPVALEFGGSPRVRIDLFSRGGKALDGQLFQPFTEPVEFGRRTGILKRQNHVDFL